LEKRNTIAKAMPANLGKQLKKKPAKCYKADGSLSANGVKWFQYLYENNLDIDTEEILEAPNPGSPLQLKNWLFELGWEPLVYKKSKNTGQDLPQIKNEAGELCESITEYLAEAVPAIKELSDYYVIRHRLGIFKSFIASQKDGYINFSIGGLTNTLRVKHSKPLANLPGRDKFYGKEIRSVVVANGENDYLCGIDISGLESTTANHYMYDYDPEYVMKKTAPDYDPHLDLAERAGLMTAQELIQFKSYKKAEILSEQEKLHYDSLTGKRHSTKTVNFACIYGAYPRKIASILKCDLNFAEKLFNAYWELNRSVGNVQENAEVVNINNQLWVWNPVAGYYIFLKNIKDVFSSLNQSTGVYVFDRFTDYLSSELKLLNIFIPFQYHDEVLFSYLYLMTEEVKECAKIAVENLNKELQLNLPIKVSTQVGKNYEQCH
jgi:hypothetical protein